jgi:hypothetical protein
MFRSLLVDLGVKAPDAPSHGLLDADIHPDIVNDYQTKEGRDRITSDIRKLSASHFALTPALDYPTAMAEYPHHFEKTVTFGPGVFEPSENRLCRNAFSKVHKLDCGHYVFCTKAELCGSNCQESTIISIKTGLHCLLCLRGKFARGQKQHPTRWHELLLPSQHNPENEVQITKIRMNVMRDAEPVYIDSNGMILIPQKPLIVAYIRSWEMHRENLLEERIGDVCTSLGYPNHTSASIANLNILLCNHQMILHVDLFVVGAISVVLTLCFEGIHVTYTDVATLLDVPEEPNTNFCIDKSLSILTEIVARQKLDKCLAKLPRAYRRDNNFKKTKISEVARRIRSHALDSMTMSKGRKDALFIYVIAACVQQAMAQFQMRITMEEVCEAMNIIPDNDCAPGIEEGLTKAKFVEVSVRRFAAAKDWTKPVGTKKEEIRKVTDKRTKAHRGFEGVIVEPRVLDD